MSEAREQHTQADSAPSIASIEQEMHWTDAGLMILVIIAACFYLYQKLWKKRGTCAGCSGQCGKPTDSCETKTRQQQIPLGPNKDQ